MAESLNDDPVYVAVSKDVRESRLTLLWALRHLPVKKLYILYVHQHIPMNPTSSGLEQSEIDAIQELELSSSYESLDKYRDIFQEEGVINDVDILCTLANDVGEGIVELIYENNIKKVVMGAAADSHYSEGMVDISSRKAKYVSHHAPHCCKIWLVCNGKLIQTRDRRLDIVGSSHSSESLSSLHGVDFALLPYEEAGKAEHNIEAYVLSSSEDQSARLFEKLYYEEQRRRLEIEELKRDKMKREREGARSSSFGVTQVLYKEEESRRRKAEEELSRANAEIEDMKRVQKELEEKLYTDLPLLLDMFQKERDEAITANEELLRRLNLEKGESSSHSVTSPFQGSVSNEPPSYFICPISKAIMQNPHVAADGYTYEADEFRSWLSHGGENSPMTNLRLVNHTLTPNLVLRSAINDWLQQNPFFYE